MADPVFAIKTHVLAGQHIRHFERANRHENEDVQRLQVKQYIPLNNQQPKDDDVTIIGTCAVSFPKEVYEPMWEALISEAQNRGVGVRSIWTVDRSDHAASAVLNEDVQGDDPSAFDLSRDILHMVNTFRDDFITPVIGFGHSLGATSLLELSRMHPRFFAALILVDPIVGPEIFKIGVPLIYGASQRPDLWPSQEAAKQFFTKSKAMKRWHPKALDAFLEFGLRKTPTRLYSEPGKVTLSTTVANESFSYSRPLFEPDHVGTDRGLAKYPDVGHELRMFEGHPFYRSEASVTWNDLPQLRPSVLYIFPQFGPFGAPKTREGFMHRTGSGEGGSGGSKMGRVSSRVLKGESHFAPVEAPDVCAQAVVEFLETELPSWRKRRVLAREDADGKSVDMLALSDTWKKNTKQWFDKHYAKGKPKL